MENILEKIMKSPDAPNIADRLQSALKDEARRRRDFRNWVDEGVKAEFINGEVVLHSPVKKEHWQTSDFLSTLLSVYIKIRRLGSIGVEKVMISLTRNDYEPDIVFFSREKSELFEKGQMLFPAPDFVVEILSKKTAAKDRGIKKQDYAAHGIAEYWIIDPERQRIEQYLLLNEADQTYFQPYTYTIDETIESRVITGFKIPVRAIFEAEANAAALSNLVG
ncbi:MAG TPA: Uma2 family endonuclease [Saprospiraceae bacterium]|nr:Uma2 family endonuclease [Saprospiraceae bacterium]HMQ81765.1 Uma2 family endonuclease [Saprospiraceae bacterium]